MTSKKLHIVSFDVPYPPNYGGAIDVFYKLKTLNSLGIRIYLHTFEYGRGKQKELEKYCEKVHYYSRQSILKSFLSRKPFVVKSRKSHELVTNLKNIDAPILFEGLHTTLPLIDNNFSNRKIFIRTHNIEHEYYDRLANSEDKTLKKIFFKTEALKLKKYESVLKKANYILTISPFEQNYFSSIFGKKTIYLPAFHENIKTTDFTNEKPFALYHGNLNIADNVKAVLFLIRVFSKLKTPLIIAGNKLSNEVKKKIATYDHIHFEKIKSNSHLNSLLKQAHINTLVTFQKTGIKLKLINALFKGKFIVANSKMTEDTGAEKFCYLANTITEFRNQINKLIEKDYTTKHIQQKENILNDFDTVKSAQKLIELL